MSLYSLQKLIRQVISDDAFRDAYLSSAAAAAAPFDLTEAEREALLRCDYGALYRSGVHGLLLRPFSIIHGVSEQDYLAAIRGGSQS
jgi:hypothetical protein